MKLLRTFLISFVIFAGNTVAQNELSVVDNSGSAEDTVTISLEIDNTDDFVAFQTDLEIPSEISFVDDSEELSTRAANHSVSASIVDGNKLRIIAFSLDQSYFSGNSGAVLTFKVRLGSVPGSYNIIPTNSIISDNSSNNLLTGEQPGTIEIISPDIDLSVEQIDYGEIPLGESRQQSVTISNNGNDQLVVTSVSTDNQYFEIIGDTSFTISASSNRSVTIQFNSTAKGTYQNKLLVSSDDPDEPLKLVTLNSVAFAVNELHMQPASGRSGHSLEINFTINNMEPFVGFQFDMDLPSVLTFQQDSVWLSDRKDDHTVSANMIDDNTLRVVGFSPNNNTFSGEDGNIVTLGFLLDGNGGNYNVGLNNVIITNENAENIISDYYSSYVNIKSPDISGNSSYSFGEVSILDTANYNYQINNYGNDTLIINQINSASNSFWYDANLPIVISQNQSYNLPVYYHSAVKGSYNDTFVIRSNDPDEDPFNINLSASSFVPNVIGVKDNRVVANDTASLSIFINNYEEFVAFQVDVLVPDSLQYIEGSAKLTSRADGHQISVGPVPGRENDNFLRVVVFSLNQNIFSGDTGTVAQLDFLVGNVLGSYPIELSNGILSDSNSEDILRSLQNGSIEILDPSPNLNPLPALQINEDESFSFPISDWFGYVSDPNNSDSELTWSFSDLDAVTIIQKNDSVFVTPNLNWNGSDTVTVTVSDGENSDNTSWVIKVNPVNDGIEVIAEIEDQSYIEDVGEVEAVSDLDEIFRDIDGDELQYSYSSAETILSVEIRNGKSLWITTKLDAFGSEDIIIIASDGEYTAKDTFLVEIRPRNDVPVVSGIPDVVLLEDESAELDLDGYVKDVDTDTSDITWTSVVLSAGELQSALIRTEVEGDRPIRVGPNDLTIEIDPVTHVATITASQDSIGVFEVEFTAEDDSGAVGRDTIEVRLNPVNDGIEVIAEIKNKSYIEDIGEVEAVSDLDDVFRDIDGDDLQYSYESAENILTVEIRNGKSLWITTKLDAFGTEEIIVTASDGEFTATDTFSVEIRPRNDAPIVSGIPDVVIGEDESTELDLDEYVLDVDADTSDISWSSLVLSAGDLSLSLNLKEMKSKENRESIRVGPNDLTIEIDPVSHIATITASQDSVGVFEVEFIAEDDSGAVGRDTIEVRLNPVNDGIEVIAEINDQSYTEDVGEVEVVENLDGVFRDIDGDVLQYSYASAETILTAEIRNGKSLWITTKLDAFGTEEIIVIASDGEFTAQDTFTVEIRPRNDAPIVSGIPNLVLREDESETIDLDGYVSDVDTDTSDISWSSLVLSAGDLSLSLNLKEMKSKENRESIRVGPNDLTIEIDPVSHIATITASRDSVGVFNVEFTAEDDSGAVGRDTIEVRLNPVNDGIEVIAEIKNKSYIEDIGEVEAVSDLDGIFRDIDGDELQYSYVSQETILSVEIRNGKSLWITTKLDAFGTEEIIVTASDGEFAAEDTFTVEIRPRNDAPVVTGIPDVSVKLESHVEIDLSVYTSDVDDSLNQISYTYFFEGNELGVEINGSLAGITGKVLGEYKLVFKAIDDSLAEDSDTITVQVTTGDVVSYVPVVETWNLLSVPVEAEDMSKTTLFPNAVSNAFFFDNGYVKRDTLVNAVGFWLKFDAKDSVEIVGQEVSFPSEVEEGWNIVGPLNEPVPVTDLSSSPDNIIVSNFFGFEGGYVKPDTLRPGSGYWVKVNQSGTIIYNQQSKSRVNNNYLTSDVDLENYPQISVSDSENNSGRLYIGNSVNEEYFELPPLPPSGIFDVRFSNNRYIKEETDNTNYIQISSAVYPVKISVSGADVRIKDLFDGSIVNKLLRDGEQQIITIENINKLNITTVELPVNYTLYQNYPNPFNPSTVIRYGIPNDSRVRVDVYNTIGQKVVTLIDEKMEAGYHEIEFKANELSSGIYFYRIVTGEFTSVKKMILIK